MPGYTSRPEDEVLQKGDVLTDKAFCEQTGDEAELPGAHYREDRMVKESGEKFLVLMK